MLRGHALGLCKAPRDNLHCKTHYTELNWIELEWAAQTTTHRNVSELKQFFKEQWSKSSVEHCASRATKNICLKSLLPRKVQTAINFNMLTHYLCLMGVLNKTWEIIVCASLWSRWRSDPILLLINKEIQFIPRGFGYFFL